MRRHEGARRRLDRELRLGQLDAQAGRHAGLHHGQGRGAGPDAQPGARPRAVQHPRQHPRAGLGDDREATAPVAHRRRRAPTSRAASASTSRCWPSTSRAWRCFWPPTTARCARRRTSSSTGAGHDGRLAGRCAGATLGECPLWCERAAGAVLDRHRRRLHQPLARGRRRACANWHLPERVGSFALCRQPSLLLLGLASGIALFDLEREAHVADRSRSRPTSRRRASTTAAAMRRAASSSACSTPPRRPIGHFYRVDARSAGRAPAAAGGGGGQQHRLQPRRRAAVFRRLADAHDPLRRLSRRRAHRHAAAVHATRRPAKATPTARRWMPMAACGTRSGMAAASCATTARRPRDRAPRPAGDRGPPARPSAAPRFERLFVSTARIGLSAEALRGPAWRGRRLHADAGPARLARAPFRHRATASLMTRERPGRSAPSVTRSEVGCMPDGFAMPG